jgi:hypothetical protein
LQQMESGERSCPDCWTSIKSAVQS